MNESSETTWIVASRGAADKPITWATYHRYDMAEVDARARAKRFTTEAPFYVVERVTTMRTVNLFN